MDNVHCLNWETLDDATNECIFKNDCSPEEWMVEGNCTNLTDSCAELSADLV